jgi:glycosyltransferase involved in cell wall biosynthesis
MEKMFISAYACEPNLGSEIGVGWNWIKELSRKREIWVLTRRSNKSSIEDSPEFALLSNVNFVYFDLPRYLKFWKKGKRGIHLYYILWQICSNRIVKEVMVNNDIRIYHLLTYGNLLWPASAYGKRQFCVIGPTSIGLDIPASFYRHYTLRSAVKEVLQGLLRLSLRYNRIFRGNLRSADLVFCKTVESLNIVKSYTNGQVVHLTDVGFNDVVIQEPKIDPVDTFLFVGSLGGWRGTDLLIEAFGVLLEQQPKINLVIVGDGPERKPLEQRVVRLGIERSIKFLGRVDRTVYFAQMAQSRVLVNSNLKEGSVTTVFDALQMGKQVVCMSTGGFSFTIGDKHLHLVHITTRRDTIIDLANKMADSLNRPKPKIVDDIKLMDSLTWQGTVKRALCYLDEKFKESIQN